MRFPVESNPSKVYKTAVFKKFSQNKQILDQTKVGLLEAALAILIAANAAPAKKPIAKKITAVNGSMTMLILSPPQSYFHILPSWSAGISSG